MKKEAKYLLGFVLFIMLFVPLIAYQVHSYTVKKNIQVVSVPNSPEPDNVSLRIVFPKRAEIEKNTSPWMQIRLRNYSLGTYSAVQRAEEIPVSSSGQSLHVIIDNKPYFARIGMRLDPFDENAKYYQGMYKFKVPFKLSEGVHTIRIFPARSFGESLKGPNAFEASYFYVGDKKESSDVQDLSSPYLTYNEPSGYYPLKKNQPVLLDFYVSNCNLSEDGYRVKLTIDGIERYLTKWSPYFIYGLQKGRHTVRLQLMDQQNDQVPGLFNDVTRYFQVD